MDFLPAAFKAMDSYSQFIVYVIVPSKTRPGKFDKLPVDKGNAHNPAIWMSSSDAIVEAKRRGTNHGVGFVFTEFDPFWFLDLDDCLIDGQWSQLSKDLLAMFPGAAVEVSSSGKGLHVFGTGIVPPHKCECKLPNGTKLEFYHEKRFAALTGTYASGDADKNFTHVLPKLIETYFKKDGESGNGWSWDEWETYVNQGTHPSYSFSGTDEELIERACNSQSSGSIFTNKCRFVDLWKNTITDEQRQNQYQNDQNKIDAGLAQHLAFWTGNDVERMKRLMLASGLRREKYERPDYLPRTILKACARQKEYLCDRQANISEAKNENQVLPPRGILSHQQQKQLFDGCVYVVDENKILVPGGYLLDQARFNVMYGGYTMPTDYANQKIRHKAWDAFTLSQINYPDIVHSATFKPTEKPGSILIRNNQKLVNTYYPVETKRVKGDITPFLEHLQKVYPHPDDQIILLSFMAAIVQFKGFKFQWCPLLQGVQGNGKTFFTLCVSYAIGDRYSHFPEADKIAEKFNDWLLDKIFIGVEDVYISESKKGVIEILKPMITGDRREIEPKGGNKITRDICANFILNTNHKEGLRKTKDDRRFAPLYCAQQTYDDLVRDGMTGNYPRNLYKWSRQHDGFAIVNDYLCEFQLPSEFNLDGMMDRAPITSSTQDAIYHGLGKVEQEILETIEQAEKGFRGGWISSIALDRLLTNSGFNARISYNRRSEILEALGYIKHPGLSGGRATRMVLPDNNRPRLYILKGHANRELTGVSVVDAYEDAQK